jgi:hypothetical protein
MTDYTRWGVIAAALLLVAGCSSTDTSGVKILSGGGPSAASANATPQAQPIRMLSAEEIRSTLIGKTWQYTRAESSGFITYNADGSLTFQDDVKGEGRGTWSAVQGELCQSIGGKPTECNEFKSTGDAYHAGKIRLVGV